MGSTLHNLVKILLPHLPPELIIPEALPFILKLVNLLPPVYRCGFECRLGENDPLIDFHQCIAAVDDEREILKTHILKSHLKGHSDWQHISTFCSLWMNKRSFFCQHINCIWLEFDSRSNQKKIPVPKIFVRLKPEDTPSKSERASLRTAQAALDTLWGSPVSGKLLLNLHRCFSTCPDGACITHIGTSFARKHKDIRINIVGLLPENLENFLCDFGWKGPVDEIGNIVLRLAKFVDRIIFALDVGADIYPTVGMECFLDESSDLESRWERFFEYLIDNRLCTPDKARALLAWPGFIGLPSNYSDWPDDLLIESLLRTPNQFTGFFLKLSHVKINYKPGYPLNAKGYFGATHVWTTCRTPVHSDSLKEDFSV